MYTLASYNVHVHLLVHEHLGFESWLLQINVVLHMYGYTVHACIVYVTNTDV